MARRKRQRKYGPKAAADVERAPGEMKRGQLHSGRKAKSRTGGARKSRAS